MSDEGSGDGAEQPTPAPKKKIKLITLDPKLVRKRKAPPPNPGKPAKPS
jgi:hypothetical protein